MWNQGRKKEKETEDWKERKRKRAMQRNKDNKNNYCTKVLPCFNACAHAHTHITSQSLRVLELESLQCGCMPLTAYSTSVQTHILITFYTTFCKFCHSIPVNSPSRTDKKSPGSCPLPLKANQIIYKFKWIFFF